MSNNKWETKWEKVCRNETCDGQIISKLYTLSVDPHTKSVRVMLDKDAVAREQSSFSSVVKDSWVVVEASRESKKKRAAKKKQLSPYRVSLTRVFLLSRAFLTCLLIFESLKASVLQSPACIE